jgi:hypothetical protein
MNAHSEARCQCGSRIPPALSRMLTPEKSWEIGKSACVTWRAQPPFWTRLWALLKDAQNCGMSPTSVAGGLIADGNCEVSLGFCGPGSRKLPALALIAPCGGSSGLPKVAAVAFDAVAATAPAALNARTPRRESGFIACFSNYD